VTTSEYPLLYVFVISFCRLDVAAKMTWHLEG
jgi:hypothetical protein